MDNDHLEKKIEPTPTHDSEISSSTAAMVISPMKNKKPTGFVSHNPLLKNITEYLVEEADAEEEELLGETSSNQPNDLNTFETDKELNKVEKFINANCKEVGKDKQIINKHQDKLDEVKKEAKIVVYFNNYLNDLKRPQLPELPSARPGETPIRSHPSGIRLPASSTPLMDQALLNRPVMWPSMSAPAHPGSSGHYYNQFYQPRHS